MTIDNSRGIVRKNYIDIAKFIGIVCVLIGHTNFGDVLAGMGPIVKIGERWFTVNVWSFHMPLFFIISGYLFRPDQIGIIMRKSKGLLIAYCTTVVSFVAYYFFVIQNHYTAKMWLLGGLCGLPSGYGETNGVGGIWFLLALFWARLIVNEIVKIPEKCYQLVVAVVVAWLGVISFGVLKFPLSVQHGMLGSAFMFVGYCMGEYNLLEKINLSLWIVCLILWLYTNQVDGFIAMVCCDPGSFTAMIGGVLGTVVVIGIALFISKIRFVSNVLAFLGRITMYVLCTHIFELTTGIMESFRQIAISTWGIDIHIFVYRCVWSFGTAILISFAVSKLRGILNARIKH